ncbi:hypothetical protein [Actinokineospora bangkokensis]|uniref:NB-ARC domain-containing protein n=1 Tax=Actinokineospora bangkokensis TaxID=1193682 RepID=A0A1Q9LF87_9PSEU|nr:hypothetical protein [Actinokineospora bangkokensis]OLR90702.1 hypothetical protein BJP25_29335 [Actinokineospora bangkokensis]
MRTADPGAFVGRAPELSELSRSLVSGVPVVVSGLGGVGKTALARRAAAAALDAGAFTRVLFVDLHGYAPGGGVRAADLFAPLLRVLGLPHGDIPAERSEQASVYPDYLHHLAGTGERVLLVLDNAASRDQVRDVLPPPPHQAVITSRDTLFVDGAARVPLPVLPLADAHAVLGEHPDLADVALACGRLPLALRVAAALLDADPDLTPAALAAELRAAPTSALTYGDLDVGTVFATAHRGLLARGQDTAAQLLVDLAHAPGDSHGLGAAAALLGCAPPAAVHVLRALEQAHLAQKAAGRWSLHDLVRRYFTEHSPEDPDATARLLHHYGQELFERTGQLQTASAEALSWFDAEAPTLVAVFRRAAALGSPDFPAAALGMGQFFYLRHLPDERVELLRAAVAATEDPVVRATLRVDLGNALLDAREHHAAAEEFRAVLAHLPDDPHAPHWERMAWSGLVTATTRAGDADGAAHARAGLAAHAERAAEVSGDDVLTMSRQAMALLDTGEHTAAETLLLRVLAEQAGPTWSRAVTLLTLSTCRQLRGDHAAATTTAEEGLAIARALGDDKLTGRLLVNLALSATLEQRWSRADALRAEVRAILDRADDSPDLDEVRAALAGVDELRARR